MDRELLQDADGVNESFWDGQGVEIEAEQVFDARVCAGTHGGAPPHREKRSPHGVPSPRDSGNRAPGSRDSGTRGSGSPGTVCLLTPVRACPGD